MSQAVPSTPPKIALVTSGLAEGGGIPTVVRWLCDGIRAAGTFTVDIHDLAASSRDGLSRRIRAPSSWIRSSLLSRSHSEYPVSSWGANAVELEPMRYRPRRELNRALEVYDIIQVVAGGPALAAAVIGTNVPVVLLAASTVARERHALLAYQSGAPRLWRSGMTLLTSSAERRALRGADVVQVLNSDMLNYVRAAGHTHAVKVQPGIDTELFFPAGDGWHPTRYLLSVCRLNDPRKGLDTMIQAYASLVRTDAATPRLVLAGIGRLPEHLSSLISHLGMASRVGIRSDVSAEDLPELYRGASVFLQTSSEEGLGISVVEAMASGLPVVSTETAGTRETVVDGVTGWLVPLEPAWDVTHLIAERVQDVLRGHGAAFAVRGRHRCVNTFSNSITIRSFTGIYTDLLSQARTG